MRGRELLCRRVCSAALAAVLFMPAAARIAAAETGGAVLTVASMDARTSRAEKQLRPLAAYLADRLDGEGVTAVRTLISPDPETLAFAMKEGKVDIVVDSPHPAMVCRKSAGAVPILLGSRNGTRNHHGHFFVRQESAVDGLQGLAGRTVAIMSPSPVAEFALPKLLRDSAGLEMKELPGPGVKPGKGEVGFVVSGSLLNTSAWVFYGKVDAGFFNSYDWQDEDRNPDAWRREFRVIHETAEAPILVVAARSGLETRLLESIAGELKVMHENPLGAAALKAYRIDYFSDFPSGALEDFEGMTLRDPQGRRP